MISFHSASSCVFEERGSEPSRYWTSYPITAALSVSVLHDSVPSLASAISSMPTEKGMTTAEGRDGSLWPTSFVAVTVNVYGTPFVKPVTSHSSGPGLHEHEFEPVAVTTV